MTWYDTQTGTSKILHTDWNDMSPAIGKAFANDMDFMWFAQFNRK